MWIVGIPVGLWLTGVAALLWLAAKHSRRAVLIVSGLAAAALVALGADLWGQCSAASSEACDDTYRAMVNATLFLSIPIALIGHALLTWWMAGRALR